MRQPIVNPRKPITPSKLTRQKSLHEICGLKLLKGLGIRYTYVVHSNVGHNLGKYMELSGQAMIEHMSGEFSKGQIP